MQVCDSCVAALRLDLKDRPRANRLIDSVHCLKTFLAYHGISIRKSLV